uniref:Protein FAR1-RELATED SEQUENCE n=1 Tax=Solanum lycopersicum TaxID=4081 RepID=A0A3Q7IW18_SOLLC
MFGVAPHTIITDQDSAITNAAATVIPNTKHHFCMWHITKKIPKYVSHVYHQYADFSSKFSWCIHGINITEEFETMWIEIMEMYNLGENTMNFSHAMGESYIEILLNNPHPMEYINSFLAINLFDEALNWLQRAYAIYEK